MVMQRMWDVEKLRKATVPLMFSAVLGMNAVLVHAQSSEDSQDQVVAAQDQAQSTQGKHHDPAAHVQKRLDKLKSALKITPDQEPQWTAFSDSVMQQVNQMRATHQQRESAPSTAPERIDRQIAMMRQRTASFETIGQAAKGLYAALSPDQQRVADERLLRWHGQHRG